MYVLVKGGLGNQMFQYAHASLMGSRFQRKPMLIDVTSTYKCERTWGLGVFGIKQIKIPSFLSRIVKLIVNLLEVTAKFTQIQSVGICLEGFDFKDPSNVKRCPILISGYWQEAKYYENDRDFIKRLFNFPDVLVSRLDYFPKFEGAQYVSIHIRRGDYLNDPHTKSAHYVCTDEWYLSAWRHVQEKVPNAIPVIFTDDEDWNDNPIVFDQKQILASEKNGWVDYRDLATMIRLDHFIISNSSFSWWGAFLGASDDSVIVAPKYWYPGVTTESIGICPSSWNLL